LATVLPPLVLDLDHSLPFSQALLHTPIEAHAVDRVCPMAYSTMIGPMLRLDRAGERRLIYQLGRALVARVGRGRAALGLGLVGPGKLANEPHYEDPTALAEDVAAARASGIGDLGVFSLEGILSKPSPERWLEALEAEPKAPPPHRGLDAALLGLRQTSRLLSGLYARAALRTSS
jgi:hypothetical protein